MASNVLLAFPRDNVHICLIHTKFIVLLRTKMFSMHACVHMVIHPKIAIYILEDSLIN